MNKEVRKSLDRWWDEFRQALKDPESWDGGHTVIALPPQLIARILTEKRNELLEILKRRRVRSVSEMAHLTKRKVESVSRDLKILSNWGFVRYEPRGKCKEPIAVAKYVLIEVGKPQPVRQQMSYVALKAPAARQQIGYATQKAPAFRQMMLRRTAKKGVR
jgi:predicted transcriptional regulator